jgi:hypothetical protein
MRNLKYAIYDYEELQPSPSPLNFWRIYFNDHEPIEFVYHQGSSLLYIYGPNSAEMENKVVEICGAIDAAIEQARRERSGDGHAPA